MYKHQGPREEVIVCIFTSFSGGIGRDGESEKRFCMLVSTFALSHFDLSTVFRCRRCRRRRRSASSGIFSLMAESGSFLLDWAH